MNVFTKTEYALEEAEFLFKSTGKAHSVINFTGGEYAVLETERAMQIFKKNYILETIKDGTQEDN